MAIALALVAALAYGCSDFVGGVLARKTSVWSVSVASQTAAVSLGLVAALVDPGTLRTADVGWAVLAGVGSGAGNVCIYRGLAAGHMAVIAPLAAVGAAVLPVLLELLTGDVPSLFVWLGLALAVPALWLIVGTGGLVGVQPADLAYGMLAGVGFGMQFWALGQIPEGAGLTAVAVSQAVALATVVLGALLARAAWAPRTRPSRLGATAGLLAGSATIAYQLAVRHGSLTAASVVTSLYPAATIVLASLVLHERIRRRQALGLALAAAVVLAVAAG